MFCSVKHKTLLELIKNQFNESYNEQKRQTCEQMITKSVI